MTDKPSAAFKEMMDKAAREWYFSKLTEHESQIDLALKRHGNAQDDKPRDPDPADPVYAWTFQNLAEFLDANPTMLAGQIEHEDIDKQELAQELQNLQAATRAPWTIELSSIRHETSNFPTADKFFDGKNFVRERLGKALLKFKKFATFEDSGDVYAYDELKGIWKRKGEAIIQEAVQASLKELSMRFHTFEVQDYIKGATRTDRATFETSVQYINLRNGVYDLDTDTLLPHSSNFHFFNVLPLTYDPTAKCPAIDKFLETILPDTDGVSRENDRKAMRQRAGYFLYRGYPIHKASMDLGPGGQGKTTWFNLLLAFIGQENVVSITLQDLETSPFAKASLYGKLGNIYDDLPKKALYSTSVFRMAVGQSPLTARHLYHDFFGFVNHAKFCFSANQLPRTTEDTVAFFRRWNITNYPVYFVDKLTAGMEETPLLRVADKQIIKTLTTPEELSGFLNEALAALKELLRDGHFANDKTTEEIRDTYIRLSDSVAAYIMDRIDLDPTAFEDKKRVYNDYLEYCKGMNYPIVTRGVFTIRFTHEVRVEDYYAREGDTRTYCWRGIRIRTTDKPSLPPKGRPTGPLDPYTEEETE